MRKYLIFLSLGIIGTIIFLFFYLSIYGIKTERFNKLIIDRIQKFDPKLSVKIKDVFLKLNIKEKSIAINTAEAKLFIEKEYINLSNIDLNLDIIKFFK